MPYDNIPHVGATYLDGALKQPTVSTQPRVLALGAASGGLSYELFGVTNVRAAEVEFGASTDVLKTVHEAVAQGANNLAIMRVGGSQGTITFTDSSAGTLQITPEFRDNTILDRYALIITNDGSINRIVVYDLIDQTFVHDSSEILVINEGIVEVVDNSFAPTAVGDLTAPDSSKSLDDLLITDFAPAIATITKIQGTDGTSMSLVEYYAALNTAYHLLDFKDADYIVPSTVYMDSLNVSDGSAVDYFKGVPVRGTSCDVLGYVWQYVYQGKLFTYFTDSSVYFSAAKVAATLTTQTDLVLTAQKTGTGGSKIRIAVNAAGAAGPTVVITEPNCDDLLITVTDNGTSTTVAAVAAINAALAAYTTTTGVVANTLVLASGGGATLLTTVVSTPLTGGTGGHTLSHTDLTGDAVPAAVTTKFNAGSDAELREVNFGHQLASFCHLASKTWKTVMGSISFLPPDSFDRTTISEWVGNLPTYTQIGLVQAIDAPADNGTGILGNKFLAGRSATGAGYRDGRVPEGNTTDGLAFGGLILTVGNSLPNGTDWPYGILDTDEALDENGAPVDIGKHLFITYDWPVHRNAFNGNVPYRGNLAAALIGKLSTLPANQEPIGDNGVLLKVTSPPKIHSTQQDSLSLIRAVGLRFETGLGYILVSTKTSAHPDSDYSRSSTIRSVNKELDGIREIGKRYLGKPFNPQSLVALQSDIDGFLQSERAAGFNQGAVASISFTRTDRILGRLNVRLQMVPPFSIERIDVTMSLAADESEL